MQTQPQQTQPQRIQPQRLQPQSLMLRPLRRQPRWQRWLVPPAHFTSALKDAIVWLAFAALLRLTVQGLLAVMPALWPLGALIVMTPALSAAYLAAQIPRLSLVLGYRSLLILLGLLLGGTL